MSDQPKFVVTKLVAAQAYFNQAYNGDVYNGSSGSPQTPFLDSQAVTNNEFYILPIDQGVAQLSDANQCCLYWNLRTLPTGATYVQITPVSYRGIYFGDDGSHATGAWWPGIVTSAGVLKEFYKFQFEKLDTTNSYVTTYPLRYHKTAVDGSLVADAGNTLKVGTRHAFPVRDPFLAFLIETDGTAGTGVQYLSVCLSWA